MLDVAPETQSKFQSKRTYRWFTPILWHSPARGPKLVLRNWNKC